MDTEESFTSEVIAWRDRIGGDMTTFYGKTGDFACKLSGAKVAL